VLADMVTQLGASVVPVMAPFSPEPGSPQPHDDHAPHRGP
jgi:UreE urease accessory protein, C-terminal domain